jgi:hypothetical protein
VGERHLRAAGRVPGAGRGGQGLHDRARHVGGESAGSPGPLVQLDHDFLWRTSKALPERGRIGIFNRSPWSICIGIAASLVLVEELIKLVLRQRDRQRSAPAARLSASGA